jgi:hypothetical protein
VKAALTRSLTHSLTHSLAAALHIIYFLVFSFERKPNEHPQSSPHTAGLLDNASQLSTVTFRAQPEGVTAGPDTSVRSGTHTHCSATVDIDVHLFEFIFIYFSLHTPHSSLFTLYSRTHTLHKTLLSQVARLGRSCLSLSVSVRAALLIVSRNGRVSQGHDRALQEAGALASE